MIGVFGVVKELSVPQTNQKNAEESKLLIQGDV